MYTNLNSPEELSGPLRDRLRAFKKRLASKVKTMPKWKKALLMASGVGLLMPATATAALTTAAVAGIPTAMTAGAVKLAKKKAAARKAALEAKSAQAPLSDDERAEYSTVTAVASTPVPVAASAPQVDSTVSQQVAASSAPKPSAAAVAIPAAGVILGLLQLLKK